MLTSINTVTSRNSAIKSPLNLKGKSNTCINMSSYTRSGVSYQHETTAGNLSVIESKASYQHYDSQHNALFLQFSSQGLALPKRSTSTRLPLAMFAALTSGRRKSTVFGSLHRPPIRLTGVTFLSDPQSSRHDHYSPSRSRMTSRRDRSRSPSR